MLKPLHKLITRLEFSNRTTHVIYLICEYLSQCSTQNLPTWSNYVQILYFLEIRSLFRAGKWEPTELYLMCVAEVLIPSLFRATEPMLLFSSSSNSACLYIIIWNKIINKLERRSYRHKHTFFTQFRVKFFFVKNKDINEQEQMTLFFYKWLRIFYMWLWIFVTFIKNCKNTKNARDVKKYTKYPKYNRIKSPNMNLFQTT